MALVIAISGTHCSGKTTTLKRLYEKLTSDGYDVGIVSEVARCFTPEERRNMDVQIKILNHHKRFEKEQISKHDIVLCDRTVMDNLAYMYLQYDKNTFSGNLPILDSNDIVYDYIFMTDEMFEIDEDDEQRNPSRYWQEVVDNMINFFVKILYGAENVEYIKGDTEIRVNKILDTIKMEKQK